MKCASFLVHYLTALNIITQQRNMDIFGVHSSLEWAAVSLLSKKITNRLVSIIRNDMVSGCRLLIYQYLTTTVHTNSHHRDGTSSETLVFTLRVAADQTQKILMHLSAIEPSIWNCYFLTRKAPTQCMMQ